MGADCAAADDSPRCTRRRGRPKRAATSPSPAFVAMSPGLALLVPATRTASRWGVEAATATTDTGRSSGCCSRTATVCSSTEAGTTSVALEADEGVGAPCPPRSKGKLLIESRFGLGGGELMLLVTAERADVGGDLSPPREEV